MANVQVTCTTRQAGTFHHEAITHLGGAGWYLTKAQVIQSIEQQTNAYYTHVNGVSAWVGVVEGQNGKYLRTYADGKYNDNLLALPACGAR